MKRIECEGVGGNNGFFEASPDGSNSDLSALLCAECQGERYHLIGCCDGRECGCMGQPVQSTNCKTCNPDGMADPGDYVKQYDMVEYVGT